MNKHDLLILLINSIETSNLAGFLELSCTHNQLAKTFDSNELLQLTTHLSNEVKTDTQWFFFMHDCNLYKKGNINTFISEIPLATEGYLQEHKILSSSGMQQHNPTFPDCIAIDKKTGIGQPLEFKNYSNFQPLRTPVSPYDSNIQYEILTTDTYKSHYQTQPLVRNVITYSDLQQRSLGYYKGYIDETKLFNPRARAFQMDVYYRLFKR